MLQRFVKTPELGCFLALIALTCVFGFFSESFLTFSTWGAIVTSATEIGIVALGITLLMIVGEFDLSIGSVFALSSVLYASATIHWGLSPFAAFLFALGVGGALGFVNGFITTATGLPSFIVTLGSLLFWRGIILVLTDGFPISDLENVSGMGWLSQDQGYGFRPSFLLWVGLGFFLFVILKMHPWGNWIMATGGNAQAAFSMGIRTKAVKMACFTMAGVLAGLAGVVQFSHFGSISPLAGEQYELQAIAIAVIGGSLLTGGVGTILGTMIGTLTIGTLTTGLVQAGVSNYWFRTFVGVIIVASVLLNGKVQKWLRIT